MTLKVYNKCIDISALMMVGFFDHEPSRFHREEESMKEFHHQDFLSNEKFENEIAK